jgi:tetratricopeptide (TPR) repeat protein
MGHAASTLRAPQRLDDARRRRPRGSHWTAVGLALCAIASATGGVEPAGAQTLWDDPAFALYRQAVEAMDRKNYAQAADLAGQAAARFPSHVLAHYLSGQAFAAQGRWTEAATAFEKVVEVYPASFAGQRDLGTSYEHLGRADDAARAWDKALTLKDSDDVRASLAFLLLKEGRRPQAQQHFGVLAEHGSKRPEVWTAMARLSYEGGDLKASEKAFVRAVSLKDDGRTWFNLGVVRTRLNDSPGALDAFEHAAQHPDTKEQAREEIVKIRGAGKSTAPERMPAERIPGTGQGYSR